jgi:hypothetical protein
MARTGLAPIWPGRGGAATRVPQGGIHARVGGAITDFVQQAFGRVDFDRSLAEFTATSVPLPGCPACAGRRFKFPAIWPIPSVGSPKRIAGG